MDTTFLNRVKKYQQILTGYDIDGNPINISDNRLEFIDEELIDEILSDSEIDLVAIVRCNLERLKFHSCSMDYALVFENSITDFVLTECTMQESQFRDNQCKNIVFRDTNLSKIQFSGSTFVDSVISNCQLNWASFNEVTFENCTLENLDFTGVRIADVKFKNCTISNCKSKGEYKISLIDYSIGKVGESDDLLDLIFE